MMEGHGIGDGETALHCVIGVEAHVAGICGGRLEAPITGCGKLNTSGWTRRLGMGPIVFLDAPRPQVLGDNPEVKPLGNFMFDARVDGGEINLTSNRKKLLIASPPSGYEKCFPPWMPDAEVDRSGQGAQTQVAFGKRSRFANGERIDRHHVEERTRRQVGKLAKQVLIHFHGLERVSANGFLNTGVEVQYVVAEMKRGVEADVEGVVGRIPVDDLVRAGQRNLAARVAHLKESADVRKRSKVQMICAGPLRLDGGARRRKQSLAAGYGIRNVQLGVQRVNRRVFENRLYGEI